MSNEVTDSCPGKSPAAECNFEESLGALEQVVHDLEDGELGLSDSLARYEQGIKHLKQCYQMLESAERRIELLTGIGEDGSALTEAFDESNEPLAESTGRRRKRGMPKGGVGE